MVCGLYFTTFSGCLTNKSLNLQLGLYDAGGNWLESFVLSFKAMAANIPKRKNEEFFLVFHNNESLRIAKLTVDKETVILTIPKNQLFEGINTFLLVDNDGNHLQERIIYHTDAFDFPNPISILKEAFGQDSIALSLSLNKELSLLKNMSVSVLPMDTDAIDDQTDIVQQKAFKDVRIYDQWLFFQQTSVL
ncbi:MAG: hypothetical protein ACI828_000160 [Flavobacteriales bacterium]|jgi:hypothetical protein